MRRAAGAVVIDARGRVLLRRPAGEYGGYAWTFPKGGVDAGETAEHAAVRETVEETGYACALIAAIGDFPGDTSVTRFYLAAPGPAVTAPDPNETEAVAWVTQEAARRLICQSSTRRGVIRDLAALEAAYGLRDLIARAASDPAN